MDKKAKAEAKLERKLAKRKRANEAPLAPLPNELESPDETLAEEDAEPTTE